MTTTTYYNLNIVEGTDIVNPLTVDNPNYEKIDETMHNNAVAGVTLATEIANATVHAITRENSDCSVIRFIATSRWKAGDTATVDGVPVTALLPSGETLPDGAYVINANVLCILTGTNLTVYVGEKKVENARDIIYNDTNVEAELNVLNENVVQINGSIEQINSNLNEIKTVVSNTEREIGTLDGSILYEKVYTVNTMSANTTVTLDTNFKIDSYAILAEVTGTVTRSNGTAYQLPYFWSTSDHINIEVSSKGLLLANISTVSVTQATVIVRYTKP